ncbi:3-isopropylmalate dehydratase large subunit [Terrarubrum flagellatum]|uniref:3-isopropylmalate dehydratase large subunit n=1 Tax=Terrirubrum flagellatum TaxID=2895980 RepID=UPI00314511FE
MQRTLFEKMWSAHVVSDFGDSRALIHIDRHVVHEGTSAEAFAGLRKAARTVHSPDLTFAVTDHIVSTIPGRNADTFPPGRERVSLLQQNCAEAGIPLFDLDDPRQGIAHVVAPELGIALPGATLVCGDSHTATCGGVGAYAWGIGTTEVQQVLATQALIVRKPKALRVNFSGRVSEGIYAKDLILALIRRYGVAAGTGYAIEYAGSVIRGLGVEGRMTICNMSIEFGARSGFVAPDDTTISYLAERPFRPRGKDWDAALASWRELRSDSDAQFDDEFEIDCSALAPQVSWGTSPQSVIGVDERIPDPSAPPHPETSATVRKALEYMELEPGRPIEGLPIDIAFIGSCTNSRLSDLQAAAEIVRGRRVAPGVRALVVPGSMQVKRAAEGLGLDRIFSESGFEWRSAGCSMCVAANEDVVPPGKRSISTSNRNFENRQGPAARTHLASPAMVAAAALKGRIVDLRKLAS